MSVVVRQAYDHLPKKQISKNSDVGGWNFLQSLCETKGIVLNREEETKKTDYVFEKKLSVAKLSLEMCTESLGTENGSETGDEISLLALEATNVRMIPFNTKPREETYSTVRENSFPPPLNSVKGFNGSRTVKTYTEDGRLVVQAIRVFSPPRCFVSERCEGRLRLCLLDDSLLNHINEDDGFEENESELEVRRVYEDEENRQDEDAEEEEEEEGLVGKNEKFEDENGNNKFKRTRKRCNENGCEPTMHHWTQQQFCVTT
ncbi:hypothetical protein N665_1172s0006 [Sinapis alba]|nr:hypothetical protein N665_1172s0006 [Sinapis alba]